MKISRRYFLKSGGIAMVGMAALPSFLQRAVASTTSSGKKKMVVLFQRGAMDGLNVVVPFGEPNYYRMRPTIAIPQPKQGGAEAARNGHGICFITKRAKSVAAHSKPEFSDLRRGWIEVRVAKPSGADDEMSETRPG